MRRGGGGGPPAVEDGDGTERLGERGQVPKLSGAQVDNEHSNESDADQGQATEMGKFQDGVGHGRSLTTGPWPPINLPGFRMVGVYNDTEPAWFAPSSLSGRFSGTAIG